MPSHNHYQNYDELITNLIDMRTQAQSLLLTADQAIQKVQELEGLELIERKTNV